MANRKGPKDDKLIQELYEKLDWFTFEATEEEFDPDQVNAIVNLLDTLDPQEETYIRQPSEDGNSEEEGKFVPASDPEAAFERFKKKYHITEEELLKKNGKAVPEKATGEKIVPFPAEFSEELTPNSAEVREHAGQTAEEKDGLPLAAGQNVQDVNEQRTPNTDTSAAAPDKAGGKHRRRFLSTVWGKIAVALLVVVVMGAALTVGTSAVHQKSFFETVQSGVNSVRIIVTGNEMESESESLTLENRGEDRVYYDSWEQVAEVNSDILIPSYIPEGLELQQLYQRKSGNYTLYKGTYGGEDLENLLVIYIKEFANDYANVELVNDEEWSLIRADNESGISYYQLEGYYKAIWKKANCIYAIEWTDLNVINEIVSKMK